MIIIFQMVVTFRVLITVIQAVFHYAKNVILVAIDVTIIMIVIVLVIVTIGVMLMTAVKLEMVYNA